MHNTQADASQGKCRVGADTTDKVDIKLHTRLGLASTSTALVLSCFQESRVGRKKNPAPIARGGGGDHLGGNERRGVSRSQPWSQPWLGNVCVAPNDSKPSTSKTVRARCPWWCWLLLGARAGVLIRKDTANPSLPNLPFNFQPLVVLNSSTILRVYQLLVQFEHSQFKLIIKATSEQRERRLIGEGPLNSPRRRLRYFLLDFSTY